MKLLMVLMTHEYESYFMLWIKIEPLSHAEIYFSTTVVVLLHLTVTPPDITPNIKTHIMTKSHVKYPCTTLVNHPIKPHKTHKITSYPKLSMKYGPWYRTTWFSNSHGPSRMQISDGDPGRPEPDPVPNLVVLRGRSSSPYNVTEACCFYYPKILSEFCWTSWSFRGGWHSSPGSTDQKRKLGATQTRTKQILKISDRTKANKNENLGPTRTDRSLDWMVRGSLTQAWPLGTRFKFQFA